MLRQLLVVLILYIIINQLILYFSSNTEVENFKDNFKDDVKDDFKDDVKKDVKKDKSDKKIKEKEKEKKKSKNKTDVKTTNNIQSIVPINLFGEPSEVVPNKYIIWSFNQPIPWNQVIYIYDQDYPFRFYLKTHVPSLNDYQSWKQILPNLDFDSKTGELIIPSKNEESALAMANLIVSNFQGQLTIDTILENNLIQISVTKAQQYDVVKNKLREQIIEALNGKPNKFLEKNEVNHNDYEEDLANKPEIQAGNSDHSENFKNENEPLAYESDNLAYL